MEGSVGRLSLSSSDEDSQYDSPKSTENSLSPTTPPKLFIHRLKVGCSQCGAQDPRCLPCLHSVCQACLQIKGKNIVCPECHSETTFPSTGSNDLAPDYGTVNFFQSIKGKLFCTSCKSDTLQAVGKCADCNSFLCKNCLMAHSLMLCFSGHKVIEFETTNESLDTNDEETLHCQQHPSEVIRYSCYLCNILMCQICYEETHHDTDHSVDTIKPNIGIIMNSMADKVKESKSHAADFEFCIKCNNQTLWCLQNQYSDITSKINQMCDQLTNQLLKYKEQQLSILETVYNRMISLLCANSKISEEAAHRLNRITESLQRLLYYGNSAQCLTYKKQFEIEMAHFAAIKSKPILCNLKFETEDDFVNCLSKTFGRVIYEMNGMNNENSILFDHYLSKVELPLGPARYEKWSNSCFDELKAISELNICDDNSHNSRPYHIKSNVSRVIITYSWKFGAYGSLQGQFTEPNGVCINADGDIIIADTNNNRVQVFDRSGKFKFCFGDGNNGDNGTLLFPNRVAVMEKSGDIIVTERAPTHQVQVYNQYGQFIRKFGATVLQHPRAVAVDKEGHIIVVECKVMRVIIFDIMGNIKHKFTCSDTLHFPNGVAVNDKQEIFISDNRTHCVVVYNYQGKQLRTIGQEGLTNYPIGVMLNKSGNVIVADNHNNFNLTVFTQDGQFVTAVESKVKHAQCYDAAISPDGAVALTSKDYRVYVYVTTF